MNVKGFAQDLFSFFQDEPDPKNPDETVSVAWQDLFTVYGLSELQDEGKTYRYPGFININTASIEVIRVLLPLGMDEFAQDILDYRAQKSEDEDMFVNPLDKGWYHRVIGLSQGEKEKFERMIRYDSNIFKATATVVLNRTQIRLSAYIRREQQEQTRQWICRIIQMERN